MAARIIYISDILARRSGGAARQAFGVTGAVNSAREENSSFHFWSGASSRRYVHTVYDLLDCPEMPQGNYMLVKRDDQGRRSVLALGHLNHQSASLNLAELRRRGARLGANEVHVHLLANSAQERRLVELDLRAGQRAESDEIRVASTQR